MKSIGIREFRDRATRYIAQEEAIAIKRHNKVVGFYIPIQNSERADLAEALSKLESTVNQITQGENIDSETLSNMLNLSNSLEDESATSS